MCQAETTRTRQVVLSGVVLGLQRQELKNSTQLNGCQRKSKVVTDKTKVSMREAPVNNFFAKAVKEQTTMQYPNTPKYLAPRAICEHFAFSRTTLWRLAQEAGFPTALKVGRAVRYRLDEVEAFLRGQED